jgi:hypothetical protein
MPKSIKKRPIDIAAKESYSWWTKSFMFIKKTEIKTWHGIFIIAFIAGIASALVWAVSSDYHPFSKAATTINVPSSMAIVEIPLVAGWNWVSLPVEPSDSSVSSVFAVIKGSYSQIKTQTASITRISTSTGAIVGDLKAVNAGMGIMINMDKNATLSISGNYPATVMPKLIKDWNWVGLTNKNSMSLADVIPINLISSIQYRPQSGSSEITISDPAQLSSFIIKPFLMYKINMLFDFNPSAPIVNNFVDSPSGFASANSGKEGYTEKGHGYDDALNLGIKWTREGSVFVWEGIEPKFDVLDLQLLYIPQEINILTNIRIGNGHTFEGSYMPADEKGYLDFVRAVVERYDGDGVGDAPGLSNPVKYWQVGNEPNAGEKGKTGFAELQCITYQVIKEACGDCQVLIGGVPGMPKDYIANFQNRYVPIIRELNGKCVDIFDFHWYGKSDGDYLMKDRVTKEDVLLNIQNSLGKYGFSNIPIWITEAGTYSGEFNDSLFGELSLQSEREQAIDYVKRYVYPLSRGVDKVFGSIIMEGFSYDCDYYDHTGLIYDGDLDARGNPYDCSGDLGLGVKKLSYYTYKLMTEKLEGSDWNNITEISNLPPNVYGYKFTKNEKPIYIIWWDYWKENINSKSITLDMGTRGTAMVNITEAVPKFERGSEVIDYGTAFNKRKTGASNGKLNFILGQNPVYIEQN